MLVAVVLATTVYAHAGGEAIDRKATDASFIVATSALNGKIYMLRGGRDVFTLDVEEGDIEHAVLPLSKLPDRLYEAHFWSDGKRVGVIGRRENEKAGSEIVKIDLATPDHVEVVVPHLTRDQWLLAIDGSGVHGVVADHTSKLIVFNGLELSVASRIPNTPTFGVCSFLGSDVVGMRFPPAGIAGRVVLRMRGKHVERVDAPTDAMQFVHDEFGLVSLPLLVMDFRTCWQIVGDRSEVVSSYDPEAGHIWAATVSGSGELWIVRTKQVESCRRGEGQRICDIRGKGGFNIDIVSGRDHGILVINQNDAKHLSIWSVRQLGDALSATEVRLKVDMPSDWK